MPTIKIDSPVRVPPKLSLEFGPGLAPPLPVSRESSREASSASPRELNINPPPSPTDPVRFHLSLSVQAGELRAWEKKEVLDASKVLKEYGTNTVEHLDALAKLARLGWAAPVVEKLRGIAAAHGDDPRPLFELGKAQILAGDYDAAVCSSEAARKKGLQPEYLATDLQARAHLLQGAPEKAASVLEGAGRRHVKETSQMVKFANGQADRKPPKFDPGSKYTARDMAEYFAWRGDTDAVIAWLNRSILAGEYQELGEFFSSPFVAPVIDDPEIQKLLAALEIEVRP